MGEPKVSKNVTFDFNNVRLIYEIQQKHRLRSFSAAVNEIILMLARKEYVNQKLESDLHKVQEEVTIWKDRYEQTTKN